MTRITTGLPAEKKVICSSAETENALCEAPSPSSEASLSLPIELASIEKASAFVASILEANDCPPKASMQMEIAIDEILSNIISYSGAQELTLSCRVGGGEIRLRFIDDGIAYDPRLAPEPDTTLDAHERDFGGLGLFMVKKSMDEMLYCYENGQNVLTLIKRY